MIPRQAWSSRLTAVSAYATGSSRRTDSQRAKCLSLHYGSFLAITITSLNPHKNTDGKVSTAVFVSAVQHWSLLPQIGAALAGFCVLI